MSVEKQFEHLKIGLAALRLATNNFNEKEHLIGEGGFGKVYKAELLLSKGLTTVALKRLDRSHGQGDSEFWKEVMTLSLYKHENIVSLLGFCDENDEKILVYKHVSRGSLDKHLNNNDLSWPQRLKICIGAARGLAHLHSDVGTQERLLHRDVKSSNILLDENWNAKITDFGLSRFGPANKHYSHVYSDPVGTMGYCDPLYAQTMLLTKESDVYSFGVVLFEALCGRLCLRTIPEREPLPNLVRESYKQKKLHEIIYGNIKDEVNPRSLKAFTSIAYQCLKLEREKRPFMDMIVRTLNTALDYQISLTPKVNIYGDDHNPKGKIKLEETDGVTKQGPVRVLKNAPLKKLADSDDEDEFWDKLAEKQMNDQIKSWHIEVDENKKNQGQKLVANYQHQQQGKGGQPQQRNVGRGPTQQQSKQPHQPKGSQDRKLHYYVDYNGWVPSTYGSGGGGSSSGNM